MNPQTSQAVSLAQSCIKRMNQPPPQTGGFIGFTKSEYSEELENKLTQKRNDYRLPNGNACTLKQAAEQLGLSEPRTSVLFTEHNSRYKTIYKNYGKNKKNQQYKTATGEATTIGQLAEQYGYSESSINRHYSRFNGDHVAANEYLKQKAKNKKTQPNQNIIKAGHN